MYSWASVAERTERVYERILATPPLGVYDRLRRLFALGPIFGPIMCCIISVQFWWLLFVAWILPESEIDIVPSGWDADEFGRVIAERKAQ